MSDHQRTLTQRRKVLFGGCVIATGLSAFCAVGCWISPFPLVSSGNGGYSTNPLDEYLLCISVLLPLLAVALAFWGRGLLRLLFIGIGLLLLVLSVFGFVANHV